MYIYDSNNNNYIEVESKDDVKTYIELAYIGFTFNFINSVEINLHGAYGLFLWDEPMKNRDSRVIRNLVNGVLSDAY